jgi:hypothetical protein
MRTPLEQLRHELKSGTHGLFITSGHLARALIELADELQAVNRRCAGAVNELDDKLRARAQASADKITGAAVDHAKAIREAYEAARRHGWKSDDETLADWIDRKCASSYCADVLQKIQAKVGPKDNLVPFEKLPDSVAKLNLDGQNVSKYRDLLFRIQAIVSPESGPAPFDKLPDLVAGVATRAHLDAEALEVAKTDRLSLLKTLKAVRGHIIIEDPNVKMENVPEYVSELLKARRGLREQLHEMQASASAARKMCVQLESENSQLRAAQPLKLYSVNAAGATYCVLAESAEYARELFHDTAPSGFKGWPIQAVDMTKPGVLRR